MYALARLTPGLRRPARLASVGAMNIHDVRVRRCQTSELVKLFDSCVCFYK